MLKGVIPAKARIHSFPKGILIQVDARFRGHDERSLSGRAVEIK